MAKGEADGVALPADGSAVVVDKHEKKVVRRATADEVSGNGNGHGGVPGLPVCPLLPNVTPYAGVKIFKGGGSKGAHVATINGAEVENLNEEYLRDTYAVEWGAGIYYLQGINAKGHAVPNEATQVNLSKPGTPTVNGTAPGDSMMTLMQAQLADARAAQNRMQELIVAMIARPADTGMSTVLAAAITALGNMGKGSTAIDPTLQLLLKESQDRANKASEQVNTLLTSLLTDRKQDSDPFGLVGKAAGAFGVLADNIAALAGGKSDVHPKVQMVKEIGAAARDIAKEFAPVVSKMMNGTPAPIPSGSPINRLRIVPTAPSPSVTVEPVRPAEPAPPPAPVASVAPQPEPVVPPTETAPPPPPDAGGALEPTDTASMDDALAQIDSWLRSGAKSGKDVAELFVHHAEVTGAFPKMILGPMAGMSEVELATYPARIAGWVSDETLGSRIRQWNSDESVWTKLLDAMVYVRQHVAARTAEELAAQAAQAQAAEAQAQPAAAPANA